MPTMANRPSYFNFQDGDYDEAANPPLPSFHLDLPSPRTGEAPPALSPLDAFAMQSRLLAKRFEDSNGRRISRLPAQDVAKELAFRKAKYSPWRSGSGSDGGMDDVPEGREDSSPTGPPGGSAVTSEESRYRPVSQYPMFGNVATGKDDRGPMGMPSYDTLETQKEDPENESGYFVFNTRRAASPDPVDPRMVNVAPPTSNMPSLTSSVDSVQSSLPPRTRTNGSGRSFHALAPPRSPAPPKSPWSAHGVRPVRSESGDEDGSTNGSHAVSSRKFSESSNASRPQSPFSPWMHPAQRSPSLQSDFSMNGGSQMPPRPMNFSRPMSSASNRPVLNPRESMESHSSYDTRPSLERPSEDRPSVDRPSLDLPFRQYGTHHTKQPSRLGREEETVPFPDLDAENDSVVRHELSDSAGPAAYAHSKVPLPRGRVLDQLSRGLRESWKEPQSTWEEQQATVQANAAQDSAPNARIYLRQDPARPPSSGSAKLPQEHQERTVRERAASSATRSRSAGPRPFSFEASPKSHHLPRSSPSVRTHDTDSTDRTVKAAKPLHERSPSSELTAEEHLEIGIQAHSRGELNKSTYHLRLAARAGLPTAMLLYALACRHGWGMRPNQADGVMWLRKAIENAGIDSTDVDATLSAATSKEKNAAPVDRIAEAQEQRKRKAQFALAIYELGISYMNGWGCSKDKALAVRCYEVAGAWGDCDALAEAGFCYTQGLGVKKDLKKAAAYYRKAADGGMSMAGNSWIYKPKYMDDKISTSEKDKKQPSKPETAGLFKDSTADNDGCKTSARPRARSLWGRNKKDK